MQVVKEDGEPDHLIWEHELTQRTGKRLDKYAKKAVAPIILLGYFRDVLTLSYPERNLQEKDYSKIMENSSDNVKRIGKLYKVIPRFVDFALPDPKKPLISKLFQDIQRLYSSPGTYTSSPVSLKINEDFCL